MRRLLGGICMAVGILIAGASGLCSMFIVIFTASKSDWTTNISMVLVFGGTPFMLGLGLFFAGRSLVRRTDQTPYDRDVF
jgi:amino acid transporter